MKRFANKHPWLSLALLIVVCMTALAPTVLPSLWKLDNGVLKPINSAWTVFVQTASEIASGIMELATNAETITGTATDKVITPANITAKIDTDTSLAGNLDTRIPSQKAVKAYADTKSPLAGSASLTTTGALISLKLDHNVQTLSGTKTLTVSDLPIQKLDPDGADRDVNLPAEASSTDLVFWIFNMANGAGEDLVIKDDTPTTLATILPGNVALCSCDGTTWTVRIMLPPDKLQVDGQSGAISISTMDLAQYDQVSIEAAVDGATAPDVAEVLTQTGKAVIRQFSGVADQDVEFVWMPPADLKSAVTTIKYRVIGFVSNATAPANGEIVSFQLSGAKSIDVAKGDAVASNYTAGAGVAQYDPIVTAWSTDVTIANLTAGVPASLKLLRDADGVDTYAQKFGVWGIEIKVLTTRSGS